MQVELAHKGSGDTHAKYRFPYVATKTGSPGLLVLVCQYGITVVVGNDQYSAGDGWFSSRGVEAVMPSIVPLPKGSLITFKV